MVWIVGVGPGEPSLICPQAVEKIIACDTLIGGKRNLEAFSHLNKKQLVIDGALSKVCDYIEGNHEKEKMTVIASGDPNVFSITEVLKRKLPSVSLEIVPGISALQYLCAKVQRRWDDLKLVSCHGKSVENALDALQQHEKIAIWTGGGVTPSDLLTVFLERGIKAQIIVGENLSYLDERILKGTPEELVGQAYDGFSIMLIEREPIEKKKVLGVGIPDSEFIRGKVPMTKQEIRVISLSKLQIRESDTVWDIGAGTGSVTIECALQAKKGTVYAIEKNPDAVELITQNALKFAVNNMTIIEGEAPEVLCNLPKPDKVFIGGSGGNMCELLQVLDAPVRVVVNAVTIETVIEAVEAFQNEGYEEIDCVEVAVTEVKKVGTKHMKMARNPITILTAYKGEQA